MSGESVTKPELFVRSIPYDATQEDLENYFSEFAPVKHAVIVKDSNGDSKGFGFVGFGDKGDAAAALSGVKTQQFKGKRLLVEYAQARTRKDNRSGAEGEKPRTKPQPEKKAVEKRRPRLIIRNMPWSVRSSDDLVKIFSKYGKVMDAYIPRGKGGKMAGFAFVTMRKNAAAKKAIEESSGLKIAGREVAVDFAIEKQKYVKGEESNEPEEEEFSSEDESDDEDGDNENSQMEEGILDDEDNSDEDEDEDDQDEDGDDVEDEEEEDQKPKHRPASNSCTIFVRNIPYDATSEDLAEHFEAFGPVRYALPVFDKKLNQPKGVAFVAFQKEEDCESCANDAPSSRSAGSLLLADDVDPRYVFEGRILSVSRAVERERADKLAEISAQKRKSFLGKENDRKDKRNIFLLNEGRITSESKVAYNMPASELEVRQKSYDLRKKQLEKNPSLHLSLTRLAVRNIPRVMTSKALKALARKAIVEFAKEVKEGKRQPLTKEELNLSTNATEKTPSKHGVVKQSKIITEHKASGDVGRSRGYGFLEFKNHKYALMGLRWLNAHMVSKEEILTGLEEEEAQKVDLKDSTKRRLVVEFALENAQVVRRRKDHHEKDVVVGAKRKREEDEKKAEAAKKPKKVDRPINHIIGKKRRERKQGKRN